MIRCSCSRINIHVFIQQWYSSSFSTFRTSFHLLDQITLYVTILTLNFYFQAQVQCLLNNLRQCPLNIVQCQTSSYKFNFNSMFTTEFTRRAHTISLTGALDGGLEKVSGRSLRFKIFFVIVSILVVLISNG